MNIDEWINLPPEQLAEKLRDMQMTREEYDAKVAAIEADRRMAREMEAAGTPPKKPAGGKMSDPASFGITPTIVE